MNIFYSNEDKTKNINRFNAEDCIQNAFVSQFLIYHIKHETSFLPNRSIALLQKTIKIRLVPVLVKITIQFSNWIIFVSSLFLSRLVLIIFGWLVLILHYSKFFVLPTSIVFLQVYLEMMMYENNIGWYSLSANALQINEEKCCIGNIN